MYQDIGGYGPLARCPLKYITDETKTVMKIYMQCRNMTEVGPHSNGVLPINGGVMNQFYTCMMAFEILDNAVRLAMKRIQKEKHG